MSRRAQSTVRFTLCLSLACLLAAPALAVVQPERSGVAEKQFRHSGFEIRNALARPDALAAQARGPALADLQALGLPGDRGLIDPRSGRWGTLTPAEPLVPGRGVGNGLRWQDVAAQPLANERALGAAAWDAFAKYLGANRGALRVDPAQLGRDRQVTVLRGGDVVQIHAPREVGTVPVRDSYLTAVINQGNLVLFGAHQWGDVRTSVIPSIAAGGAHAAVAAHVAPFEADGSWGKTDLVLQPLAADRPAGKVGDGYDYRLAWVVRPTFAGEHGRYEALVDAHSGELLSFVDTNHYQATTREVVGGVLPVSNDGQAPDGVEQPGWPMPFADLALAGSGGAVCGNGICETGGGEDCLSCSSDCRGVQSGNPNNRFCCGDGDGQNPVGCSDSRCTSSGFQCTTGGGGTGGAAFVTDSGGNLLVCVDGEMTTALSGEFMRMNDDCGAISESTTGAVLDLGTSPGTDCNVAGGASPGNTRSSRSGFFEMNRIQEQARGQIPANGWLDQQLTANMNINSTCNAFWNGATVNFYRSGGGCANTGEIAGVFDHEWGHGMDDNDANPSISNPGEGIADVYAAIRLDTSCIGRGFRLGTQCGGYGDPCIDCDGVRDIDWAKKASGQPHDVAWADANCGSGGSTPCGGSTHCEGHVYSEAVWDLFNRDLPAAGFDHNTSLEIATRLTYLGAGAVGTWFQCVTDGEGGCNASGGYLNYLAADDDNGNINDGTPHMSAIFSAFDRHGIACSTPSVVDSGCSGTPSAAPGVSAQSLDRAVRLSWGAVSGASSYKVFRTDGVFACDFGKQLVGETTGTELIDEGLLNGRDYSYVVVPMGPSDSCFGPASACTTVASTPGANAAIDATSAVLSASSGDGDVFLDNCETSTLSFDVANVGSTSLTNVRISDIRFVSHPTLTLNTALPAPTSPTSLVACAIGLGSFEFRADNGELSFDDTVVIEVDVTSDELAASGLVKTETLTLAFAESDFQARSSKTYTYETDIEGWKVIQGTFARASSGGGAQGSTWYLQSSANLADQCDHVRSPVIRLTSGSTMTAHTRFGIEGQCGFPNCSPAQWFDRANIGLFDAAAASRTPVSPDGGRLYNASGINGTCGTNGQSGWAGTMDSWASSSWSSGALGASSAAGDLLQLDVRYGTDELEHGFGFRLDHVTLTSFDEQVTDNQSDVCGAEPFCGDALCNGTETQCTCPEDCGAPPSTETGMCTDGVDNDCDLFVDCDDSDCTSDPACDTGPVCGNGTCESGEDCNSCSADCPGVSNGPPSGRHCCGNGVLEGPEGDGRCDGNV